MKIISAGTRISYSLTDLGVIIPHIAKGIERIKWFIPQYVKATPEEVVKNTFIVTDPEDEFTPKLAGKYNIKVITTDRNWMTDKFKAGYEVLKTRLCARVHNDTAILRKDWAEVLVEQFNKFEEPQLIGQLHNTGDFRIRELDNYFKDKPYFNKLKKKIEPTSRSGGDIVGTEYLHGYFMASQTYVLRDLQIPVMDFDNNNRGAEDCIVTLFAYLNNIQITNWLNITNYIKHTGIRRGFFNEDVYKLTLDEEPRKSVFSFKKTEVI